MTKWKQPIDRHLGKEPKFSMNLKQQILQQATKQRPRKVKWTYVATLVSVCVVALFFVLIGPVQPTPPQQAAHVVLIDQMMPFTEVVDVYVSSRNSERDQFIVRDSSWYLGSKRLNEPAHRQLVTTMFKEMVMTEEVTSNPMSTDMIVLLADGTQVKVKLYDYDSWVGIVDMQTKLFYQVEGELVEQIQQQLIWADTFTPRAFFWFIPVFVLQLVLPKLFGLKKQKKKYVNAAHMFTVMAIVAAVLLQVIIFQKQIPTYIPMLLLCIAFGYLVDAWFSWQYAKEQGYYKIALVQMVVFPICLGFVLFWM